jgi:di/tricarboxylate transporter
MWHVVFLALGGSALGKALSDSQLLGTIGKIISYNLLKAGFKISLAVFVGILLFITTFVSHSVGAMVFLPIIQSFADQQFKENFYIKGLVMAACFTCSAGMAMPISGFPNMTAAALQDRNGKNYVNTVEFVKGGVVPSMIIASSIWVTFVLVSSLVFPPSSSSV